MTLTITVDGVDVTAKVRLDSLRLVMHAVQGQVGAGRIEVDDTTGTADLVPVATEWSATESDATPTTIAGGFVGEVDPQRGPLTTGTQRQFKPVLEDWNTALTDRILKGSEANRPEETDYQRVTWLLGKSAMAHLDGAGQVPNTNTVTMEKASFRGKTPLDILDDCAESANKNFYVYWLQGTGWVLYYDKIASVEAAFTSSLRVSDDPADVDSSVTFAPSAVEYQIDPERVYSGLAVKWAGDWIFRNDATTETTYRRLERAVVKENIKTAAKANAWADRQLDKLDEPTKKLSLTVSVPGSALGQLRAGQRIHVKLRARGVTAFTYFRITETSIAPRQGRRGETDVEYDVKLTMKDKVRPVNLDDDYGGGDSSGGDDTGGGGSTGGGGTGTDTGEYPLDDFARTIPASGVTTVTTNKYNEDKTDATWDITIPDGSDVVGRMLVVFVEAEALFLSDHLVDEMEANGFTTLDSTGTPAGPSQNYLGYRVIDGTEGYPSTGATFTIDWGGSVERQVMSWSALFDGARYIESSAAILTDPDPPSLDPTWAASIDARWFTIGTSDSSISGEPAGYSNQDSDTGTVRDWRISTKDDDSNTEDPSAYTAATGEASAYTFAVIGSGWTPADTESTGTSHSIAIPDGSDQVGRLVVLLMAWAGTSENLGTTLAAGGVFTQEAGESGIGIEASVCYRRVDGTEGWSGSGDTVSLSHSSSATPLYVHAMLMSDVDDLPTEGVPINVSVTVSSSIGSLTPTSGFTEWVSGDPCRFISFQVADGAITVEHTNYTSDYAEDDASTFTVASVFDDTSSANEAPTPNRTFAGSNQVQALIGLRTSDLASEWGSLPLGADTGAPWEGGNAWVAAGDTADYTASLDGTDGKLTIDVDATLATMTVWSDAPDHASTDPTGPWTDDATWTARFKVSPFGAGADTDPNLVSFHVASGNWRAQLRVHLGDASTYPGYPGTYSSGDTGFILIDDTTVDDTFQDVALSAGTYYLAKCQITAGTFRGKLWLASAAEPVSWQATMTMTDENAFDQDFFQVGFEGNTTSGDMVLFVDYVKVEVGGTGTAFIALPPGDGTTTTWTIEPWGPGTLRVWVDGIQTIPASEDRAAGTFTFDRAPADGAVIRAEYTAA